jgi:hypothetical protein
MIVADGEEWQRTGMLSIPRCRPGLLRPIMRQLSKKRARQEAHDDAQISDFLRAVRFVNARRERFRGRDVIGRRFRSEPGLQAEEDHRERYSPDGGSDLDR